MSALALAQLGGGFPLRRWWSARPRVPRDVAAGVTAPLLVGAACAGTLLATGAVRPGAPRRVAGTPVATMVAPLVREVAMPAQDLFDPVVVPDPTPDHVEALADSPPAAGEESQDADALETTGVTPAAGASPTVEARPRPRPRRDYTIPIATRSTSWPFGPNVYRWQPVVEQQMRVIRATRRVDPAITPELVLAMINVESLGDPLAVSPADAVGLMQVLPSTFAELLGDADPFDPELNVRAGILYLNLGLASHGGDVEWALAAYNAGINASRRARAGDEDLWDETLDYVETVIELRDRAIRLRGSAPPPPPLNLRDWLRPNVTLPTATATSTPTGTATATASPTATATPSAAVAPAATPAAQTATPGPTAQASTTAPAAAAPQRSPDSSPDAASRGVRTDATAGTTAGTTTGTTTGATQAATLTTAPGATAGTETRTATPAPTATASPTAPPSPTMTRPAASAVATAPGAAAGAATATVSPPSSAATGTVAVTPTAATR